MSSGGGDWHESLFNSEKGDSLGDGSWGRTSDEPDLAPVAWDQLPDAPKKKKARARLATPAPGSQKESGLLDIKTLAPDLSDGMSDDSAVRGPRAGRPARLATPAKGSAGSGLIDVQEMVRAKEESEAADKAADKAARDAIASQAVPSSIESLSSVAPVRQEASPDVILPDLAPPTNRGPLLLMVGVLVLAVAGLAVFALTQ